MNDHVNILANRMRSATSAAQRKILMQQAEAMTFAAIATVLVTNQQYDASLPWSESVKPRMAKIPKRSFLEGREYSPRNQQELDLLLEVYGRGIRVTKSMQAQAMISMASDPLEAARERASKAVSLYDDADAALEKAAKEYQQAKKAAEDARVAASRELSQAMHTRDGSRPITSAEVDKMVSQSNKRLKSFDERLEKAGQAYQQARKDYAAAAAAKEKAQAEFVVAKVQARSGKMQAVNFAVTDQKGQPLKVGDKVKTSRGVTGIITEIIGSRVYVQSADSFDTHKTGEATWVEPADRLVKMQADVSMAMYHPDDDEREYRQAMAEKDKAQKAAIKIAQQYQRQAEDLVRQLDGDDVNSARIVLRRMQPGLALIERLIDAIPEV